MRLFRAGLLIVALLIASEAATMAAPVPMLADVGSPYSAVYARLLAYYSPGGGNLFEVVHASKASGTIEVRRANIDEITWSEWAYCQAPSAYIFTSLTQATADVTIKLSRNGANRTYVTVTPDFVAVYGEGSSGLTVHCVSNRVLEPQIIKAAGPNG